MSAEINDPEPVMVQDGVEKEDPDPVTAEYNVYLTPSDETQQLYLLQYPNRSRKDTFRRHAFPAAMRIKPSSGFMEMDLPVHFTNFDRAKGVRWGEALRQAKEEGISGFGVAGGFANITQGKHGALKMKPPKPRAAGIEDGDMEIDGEDGDQDEMDKLLENFEDSVEKGHVLSQQTLGGQILKSEAGKPVYMLGAFRENELHLTGVAGIVQMRPQFHHIDAQSRLDQAAKRRAERGPAEPSGSDQARTIFESIKNVDQSEPDPSEHFSSYLLKAKEEPWTKLRYHDDESDEAFRAHDESLKLAEPQDAEELTSSMTNDDYLDAISAQRTDPSGRRKTKPMTKKQMAQVDLSDDDSDASVEAEQTNEQTAEKPTGRRSIK